jgi:hypothetical protein
MLFLRNLTDILHLKLKNRADIVGHSVSTRHGYCYCAGFLGFLSLQRQHIRGTIFGIWGMTNSIRAFFVRQGRVSRRLATGGGKGVS